MKLPVEFEMRMRRLLGDDYEKFADTFDAPPVRALRVNTLKMQVEDFLSVCDFPIKPVPFCSEGFYFENDRIGHHPLHHSGAVYVQEPAAMAVVECTDIKPGMRILDLCASPGGKTTQAAARLGGRGLVVSNEIVPDRCRVLMQNAERMGICPIVITSCDTGRLGQVLRGYELVIVDAPCSGEGMMRKNPRAVAEWSVENIEMCARRQREILDNAAKTVAVGGRLIYSTCTFAPEENEMQVDRFLSEHPDFRLTRICDRVLAVTSEGVRFEGCKSENIELCRRFYPHISPGEGQFMALLERVCDSELDTQREERAHRGKPGDKRSPTAAKASKDMGAGLQIAKRFISEVLHTDPIERGEFTLEEKKDGFYLVPADGPDIDDIFMPGVKVGTVEKGRVLPHHRFFMAFGRDFKVKLELLPGDPRISAYLHGDIIPVSDGSGCAAVLYCGAVLGGGKISGGMLKNYYPKGLRE